MGSSMTRQSDNEQGRRQAQDGFSIIEVMVSMVVLTVGLVSLLGVFGLAMASTQSTQQDMIAKQLADEAYESIVTARNTSQITFDDIQNTGSMNCPVTNVTPCGIFLSTPQQIYNAGADGIYGTADDSSSGSRQTLHDPGPDGIFGTSDDVYIPLTGYQRTITIGSVTNSQSQVIDSLRSVTITVQYTTPQTRSQKSYILNSYISEFQ
ncbi:MAG: prepilin-type N-terminal cleavage/methylation domain-containing protein [Terriglobales bacterium]